MHKQSQGLLVCPENLLSSSHRAEAAEKQTQPSSCHCLLWHKLEPQPLRDSVVTVRVPMGKERALSFGMEMHGRSLKRVRILNPQTLVALFCPRKLSFYSKWQTDAPSQSSPPSSKVSHSPWLIIYFALSMETAVTLSELENQDNQCPSPQDRFDYPYSPVYLYL